MPKRGNIFGNTPKNYYHCVPSDCGVDGLWMDGSDKISASFFGIFNIWKFVYIKYFNTVIKVTCRGNCLFTVAFHSVFWLFLSCCLTSLSSCPAGAVFCLPLFSPIPLFSPLRFQLHPENFYGTKKRSSENWHFIHKVNPWDCAFPFDFQVRTSTEVTFES